MFIKKLTDQNAFEHEKLASQAFVFPYDEKEALPLPSELMLGAFTDEGKLAADMEIYDRVCFFGKKTLSCAAVGGVASKPEYRRGGAVRALFAALETGDIPGKTWDICLLYPFSAAFYKKLGFAPVGTKLRVKVPFSEFAAIPVNTDVWLFEGNNEASLLSVYNEAAAKQYLAFRRDDADEWEKNPYSSGEYTYLRHDENGEEKAYATFSLDRGKSEVNVKEIFFTDKEAMLGILGFLRCFEGNFRDIVFECLPGDTPILFYIADTHKAEITASAAGAVKIFHYENVLKANAYPEAPGRFTVGIENGDTFDVSYGGGKAEIKKTTESPDVLLSPLAAAKIFTEGLRDKNELLFLPGVKINGNTADLLRAFPFRNVFFNDSF